MLRRWAVVVLALGCAKVPTPEPPAPPPPPISPPPAPVPPPPVVQPRQPRQPAGLFSIDEAVESVLSGTWIYVGTGPWTGNARLKACAYRNERVLFVNVYCTVKEQNAFALEVFSPVRGRVRIYAEAKAAISPIRRRDYFTFKAESEPPPSLANLGPVSLTMSFDDLLAYDGRRYRAFPPVCYGGVELNRRRGGCVRGLGAHTSAWAATNRSFLKNPPESWYRIVRELRALARQHGQDPR
jgi:hypothetical protein